ncbi:uncharacterized protein BT62DRAFT_982591 [Guyanagaster necrorhizus]|uniref:Oxidoreductase n=1 Tax=Guyanagaster necrorhizus TaxID=856835 RepID=A0A9P8APM4_9AGAR|nr:uncharacterized protein BT62DRAFT_982591 [Guyanagaster necrorhizus MCA 3950]KAG7442027.1 hypothetical protein BT62DRAFT_982591 [Guyanagaster necrorhizus MCA 3950]
MGGRAAIVGTGSRAAMFVRGIVERPASTVVAILEPNSIRAAYYNDLLKSLGAPTVPVYKPEQFKVMLRAERVDAIVVTCINALHHLYIIPALEAAVRSQVISIHFEWLLDTVHGTDYFHRWYRQKGNSGGLMVHKSGHHFDLVNRWIDSEPETVAGMGTRNGWARDSRKDPFAMHIEMDDTLQKLYTEAESEDGYHRDMKVFGPDIAIEDDMSVMVRYKSGATLTYHLTTYSPWEGYHAMFNGSEGRLELDGRLESDVVESDYRSPNDGEGLGRLIHGTNSLPHAGGTTKPQQLPVKVDHSAHGRGDIRMLSVLFGAKPGQEVDTGDASKQSANERDGAMALAVGVCANESFKTGKFVDVASLNLPL